jgi:hypothetical protein
MERAAIAGVDVACRASTSNASRVNATLWQTLAWLGVALQMMALLAVVWLESWDGLWSIGIFLVLSGAFLVMKEHVPSLLSLLVVIAALMNAGGWAWEWFDDCIWFDETIHTFSAFAVVAAIMYRWWARDVVERKALGGFVLAAAGIGISLGIAWEIFEASFLDLTVGDTISDLLCDVIGAAVGGAFAYWAAGRMRAGAGVR